jgi:hypothetical protein
MSPQSKRSPRKRVGSRKRSQRKRVGGGSPTNRRKRRSRSPEKRGQSTQEPTQRKMLVARRTANANANAFPLLPRTPQEAAEHKRRMSSSKLTDEQRLRQLANKSNVEDEAVFLPYPPEMTFLPSQQQNESNPAYEAWYGGKRRSTRSRSS